MKSENYTQNKNAAEKALDEAIFAYNNALDNDNLKAMKEATQEMERAKMEYNLNARYEFYSLCLAKENPLFEACKILWHDGIYVKFTRENDVIVKAEKDYKQFMFAPRDFYNFADDRKIQLGMVDGWLHKIEKYTKLMTLLACESHGYSEKDIKKVKESYAIRRAAEKVDMEIRSGKDPLGYKTMSENLENIIKDMLGVDYAITVSDFNFVKDGFCKKSPKALTLVASTSGEIEKVIAQVCNRIILDKRYTIAYRVKKGKEMA